MIVVDTSALIAILFGEPEARSFGRVIFEAREALVAAPTAFEYRMVSLGRRRPGSSEDIEGVLADSGARIVPWAADHALIAQDAFLRYGKGRGHPAQLNFGDCMSYALAKAERVPLLFKGGDFALTDITPALPATDGMPSRQS